MHKALRYSPVNYFALAWISPRDALRQPYGRRLPLGIIAIVFPPLDYSEPPLRGRPDEECEPRSRVSECCSESFE